MKEEKPDNEDPPSDLPPPFFRRWRGMYIFLLAFLILQILLYYLFTQAFS